MPYTNSVRDTKYHKHCRLGVGYIEVVSVIVPLPPTESQVQEKIGRGVGAKEVTLDGPS